MTHNDSDLMEYATTLEYEFPKHPDEAKLETIPNRWTDANFEVTLVCEDFSCICPHTSIPDSAQIVIKYTPKENLIEAKSMRMYLTSYRNVAIYHEFAVNKICNDLVKNLKPKYIEVTGNFATRDEVRIIPVARWVEETK